MDSIVIIFVIISIVMMFLFTYGKRVQMDRLAILLECEEFEQFDKVADSILCKLLVKHYDLETAKLNSYILRKDKEKTNIQFDFLLKVSQSKQKHINLCVKAFEYYVYESNPAKAKALLRELEKIAEDEIVDFCKMEYEIVIEQSVEYIERLQSDSQIHTGQRKAIDLYLLKRSYENEGNFKKSKEIECRIQGNNLY